MSRKGWLVVFEGIDGTGKSTQIDMAAAALAAADYNVVITREPTNGPFGKQIRELYQSRDTISHEDELALFLEDRREHVTRFIAPSLAAGKVVLCDRYYLSNAAYQGATSNDPEYILKKNEEFAPVPDLAIIIELPVLQAIKRIEGSRCDTLNAFEQEKCLQQAARIYRTLSRPYIRWVDGFQDIGDVHDEIMAHISKILLRTNNVD